jgi:hypothetical protein
MLTRHHQIALVDERADRVLVVPGDDGPRLPRHPSRWPDHHDLVETVAAPDAFVAGPPFREDDGTVTHVLLGHGSHLEGATWHPLAGLGQLDLSAASQEAVLRTLRERREGAPDDGRAAWFRPGWREAVDAWVDEQLPLLGLEQDGPAEPFKVWSLSAVLRYPVRRSGQPGEVWFKATCAGFHGEPALTGAISGLAPDVAPRVLAVDGERAWMLMEPIPNAADETHAPRAPEIARRLARLQLDTLGERDTLLAAGAPDRGREATIAWLHTVVHDSVEQPLMTPAQRAAAREIEPWLVERVETLWSFGLPDALNHGDLHLGNVAWTDHGPLFFDWTDACLTHPFLDARHLADSAAETGEGPRAAPEQVVAEVWEAYAAPWREAFPDVDLDEVWRHVRDVEAIFQMISYEQIYRAQPESQRWELATIVVELLDTLVAARREAATAR